MGIFHFTLISSHFRIWGVFLFYGLISSHPEMWRELFIWRNIRHFLSLRLESSALKCGENFFWRNRNFLHLELKSFIPKYQKKFFFGKYSKVFQDVFFLFLFFGLGLKSVPAYSISIYSEHFSSETVITFEINLF